jgi:hypothetical protein
MSIFRSIGLFISSTFDHGTRAVGTVGKGVDIINHTVEVQHKRITKISTVNAQMSVARHNDSIADELDSSAKLQAQFDSVVANW